jgi:hypothetical protein
MKKFVWIALLALLAMPAWCAKKITVAELKDSLASMHRENKNDTDVANALKQVELSEQLTRNTMNSMVENVPGPLSTEQIYVLEARSALLAPPATDLPATAAPDAAAQKAMLDKAADYVSKTYEQLPPLTVTKTTIRFQDNIEAAAASSGLSSGAQQVTVGSSFVNPFQFIHYINSTDAQIATEHGAEKPPAGKDKTLWGANRMIALQMPDPSLGGVFQEAQAAGDIKFLRWELVNGKPAAVFTFDVPKKKAHFEVNVCCFPDVDQAGLVNFTPATPNSNKPGSAAGNLQTTTSWHPFKANVPYHGEFFIDPDTGIVVRMITQAELKQNEVVHQDDTRIDYGPVTVGGKAVVLPMKVVVLTEVVPNGDSGSAGAFSLRKTFFTSEYKNYSGQ